MNNPFSKREYNNYFYIGGEYKADHNKFSCVNDNLFFPEEIIISYLHLLYNSYIIDRGIESEYLIFSVPDYFTCYHKNSFKIIIDSINIKEKYSIINESTAITLYFGYKKYNEYFINKKQIGDQIIGGIDPKITKYILFIDAGHSKTTFIFSKLNYCIFQVLNSTTIPFLGGRDFDNKIFEYCSKNFMDTNGIDISKDNKIKLRMMNPIIKARKNLTVNKDAHINIESLKDDNDLSLILKKEDFENLIKEELDLFKKELQNFCDINKQKYPNALLTNIEMAGELMRTPCLQNIVKEVTGLSMSKTIITDECIAIGCSLYGTLLNNTFPIKDFNGIYQLNNYTINILINDEMVKKFIGNDEFLPSYKAYFFDDKYFESQNSKIIISFFYDKKEINNYLESDSGLLLTFEFDCNEIIKSNGGIKNAKITFFIDNDGIIKVHSIESKIFEEQYMKIEINDNIYKILKREIYPDKNEIKKLINEYKNKEKELFEIDRNYINYSRQKDKILSKLYTTKSKINDNKLGDNLFENRKINEILDEIENDLNNNALNLDNLNNRLDNLVKNLISDDLKNKTKDLSNKIMDYQNKLSEEYQRLLSGDQCMLNEKQINEASNMLEHFIKKLSLVLSIDDLNNLVKEFDIEIKKYF
jgi:molecular chaperone DnaK (HSP70)